MKLRRLDVRNFRGIEELSWRLNSNFVCLVGPGDSTKTTVLDALGLVLSSRFNVSFSDSDFYRCDTTRSIEVTAVVTDLPDKLIEERTHGKHRSGVRGNGHLEHDPLPEDDVDECLVVRLTVNQGLEPVWEVIRPGFDEGVRISAGERAQLGFFRIGEFADTHLKWGRGSALSDLTTSKTHATNAVVEAQRSARQAVADLSDTPLHEAAELARKEAIKLGSAPYSELQPGLDSRSTGGSASLMLHERGVPLSNYGLGSRRLTSLAIQDLALQGKSIVGIDEVEHGLDPHRLLHLVRHLRRRAERDNLQVIVTTHAPLVVESLETSELFVVRSASGKTTVSPVPPDFDPPADDTLQGVMRERPSALLASRIVVGEGATEVGFVRAMLWQWDTQRTEPDQGTAVTGGLTVSNGSGDAQAPRRAKALAGLGYPTFLVLDGDAEANADQVAAAKSAGVEVLQWSSGNALEDVIVSALPVASLQALVDLAVDERSEESVQAVVASQLELRRLEGVDVNGWIAETDQARVRAAIASAAKGLGAAGKKHEGKAWFKREDRAERLAAIVLDVEDQIAESELGRGLAALKTFVYGAEPDSGAGVVEVPGRPSTS